MQIKSARGQGVLMTVLLLGILMATVIIFGSKRHSDVAILTGRLEASQAAAEVLSAATKRIQGIFANEAGCDPNALNSRLSRLTALTSDVYALGFGDQVSNPTLSLAYVVAQPAASAGLARFNICTANGGKGCRQLAVNLENFIYVITAGKVVAMDMGEPDDAPQDTNIHLSVAINGNVFSQWSTLINVCTLKSRNDNVGGGGITSLSTESFVGTTATTPGGSLSTTACQDLTSRYYGSLTGTNGQITSDDLRWARRYLETGGGEVGETTDIYATISAANGNGACLPAASVNQCIGRACVPALDVNLDRTNNEADLGILELYLRGYLLTLPVTYLH